MILTQEEFEEGLHHPVMKEVRRWLEKRVKQEQDAWASGRYSPMNIEQAALANLGAVGRVQGYLETLALDYDTYAGDMSEQFGFEAKGSSGTGGALRAGDEDSGGVDYPATDER